MANRIGIDANSSQRIISGVLVAFDWRTTAEVESTRDPKNRRSSERPMRESAWRDRQRSKQQEVA